MKESKKTKITIVKVGGLSVEDTETRRKLLLNFSKIKGRKVLVHGGGVIATTIAKKLDVESQMIEGRRVTSSEMLDVAIMVYAGLVNKKIVTDLQELNVNSLGLTGSDLNCIRSEKRPVGKVDYGYVGDIKEVNADVLAKLIRMGIVPILAPLTHDGNGQMLNTNADAITGSVSKALTKHFEVKLIFCFDKKGVLLDPNNEDSVIPLITESDFKTHVTDGTITGGMIPKLENAFHSLYGGVLEVHITNVDSLLNGGTKVIK